MLKRVASRPWICSACRQRGRRSLAGLAAASPAISTPLPSQSEDDALRRIFDSEPFWKGFIKSGAQLSGQRAGLLHNRYLTSPQGFHIFAHDALAKCKMLVAKLTAATSTEEFKTFPRDFDRLSDQLCRVIDSVEFVRNVHPDERIQQAATEAHMAMYEYMNVLNTHKKLYDQLKLASETPEATKDWSEEERTTTNILLKDFGQSAIDKPEHVRRKFVELSNDIVQTGADMLDDMSPQISHLQFDSRRLNGMDPTVVRKLTSFGTTTIPTSGRAAMLALRTVEDPEVRKEIYIASRASSKKSIARVEHLLKKRAELAQLCDYESFADMTLSDKMAKTPQAVDQFLLALAADNRKHVNNDMAELMELKAADAQTSSSSIQMEAWDRLYYTRRLRSLLYPSSQPSDSLSAYFSLGTVMQGLSRLFTSLYGVRLVPKETPLGETWNDDVRRLDVIDETEGHIAVLYCDLFERPNKSPNPAHFTLRCSREISASEIAEAAPNLPPNPSLTDLSNALNDGMALNYSPQTGTLHQLPTIAFICDFPRPRPGSSQPTLLTFSQVCTLFHEMGHALHSILGRTKLQNVAGTRCATDFAELPSILMEYFAASPAVLQLYARHWATDAPLAAERVAADLAANRRLLASQETETQILFSVLDQRYHSGAVPPLADAADPAWDSSAVYHAVYSDPLYASAPEPRGAAWQGFFSHLFGYGAVYYSYLFDRAIAGRVWSDVFRDAPLERARGLRYRDEVLRWGGARDGWRCVAGVLGRERYGWLEGGGEAAMAEVGKWGAGEAGQAGAPL